MWRDLRRVIGLWAPRGSWLLGGVLLSLGAALAGLALMGIAGQGVECPNCVSLTCPRCSYSKNYPRGQEPESCPMCYTTTCSLCGATGYARRDQQSSPCPNCIRIRCTGCGSILYQGSEANKPTGSIVCKVCSERAAAAAAAAGGQ